MMPKSVRPADSEGAVRLFAVAKSIFIYLEGSIFGMKALFASDMKIRTLRREFGRSHEKTQKVKKALRFMPKSAIMNAPRAVQMNRTREGLDMDAELIAKIDGLIEKYTDRLVADTVAFVNIKSVEGEAKPGAPFGEGPKRVLDAFLRMSGEDGFYTKDHGVGVVSAAMKRGKVDLGIWIHGDVVPEGDGWRFAPYDAVEYKGCVVGRGAADNKGQLAAIYNLFKIFKELGVSLRYNPAIFVGSNEETGMHDADAFLRANEPPALSLVPDSGFPVCYGGKGGLNITLRSNAPLRSLTFSAGQPASPGLARATVKAKEVPERLACCEIKRGEETEITAFTPPRHGASPDPDGNMITRLSEALLDAGLVREEDRLALEFLKTVSSDIYGKCFGINTHHEVLGGLTVFSRSVDDKEGCVELTLGIRYPLGTTYEKIVERVENASRAFGFSVAKAESVLKPYLLDKGSETVRTLWQAARDVTHDDREPYTMSGGTYANKLPNAYVFGTNANVPPADFPKGHGGAHGIDEAVSIEKLKRAMKIYARALLLLNERELLP